MAARQALPSLGFSRQEHWSGLPFPSPMHESEKWKWSHSVVSNSSRPHGLQPTRLLRPWDFPGKSTGVGCHCLRHLYSFQTPPIEHIQTDLISLTMKHILSHAHTTFFPLLYFVFFFMVHSLSLPIYLANRRIFKNSVQVSSWKSFWIPPSAEIWVRCPFSVPILYVLLYPSLDTSITHSAIWYLHLAAQESKSIKLHNITP